MSVSNNITIVSNSMSFHLFLNTPLKLLVILVQAEQGVYLRGFLIVSIEEGGGGNYEILEFVYVYGDLCLTP